MRRPVNMPQLARDATYEKPRRGPRRLPGPKHGTRPAGGTDHPLHTAPARPPFGRCAGSPRTPESPGCLGEHEAALTQTLGARCAGWA